MWVHFGFVIDGCQLPEAGLSAPAVVGALYPPHDSGAELFSSVPNSLVKDILLEEREETFHGRVIPGGADPAHAPDQPVSLQSALVFPGAELTGFNWWLQHWVVVLIVGGR